MKRFTIDKLPAPSHNANNPVFMENARYYNGMVSFGPGLVQHLTYPVVNVIRSYRNACFVVVANNPPTYGVLYSNGIMEIVQIMTVS